MNATVEEYTSDEGLNFEKRERHQRMLSAKKDINEKAEPQLKSTIKGSTSPKQANVSWNESVPQDIAHKTYGGRRSGFSEATTAVPPSDQPIGDSRRNNHKSPRLDYPPPQHQVQQGSRRHEIQAHSNYCSTSTPQSAGDWYVRRTLQQNANILPHGQTQYANPFHPAYPRSLNHSATPAHYQPSPYPFSGTYTGAPQYLYGQPGESTSYGSAFREDPFYPKSYQDYEVAAQGRKTSAQPLPYHDPPFQAEGVDEEGNKVSAKLEDVLENISQVLNQHNKAKPETKAVDAVAATQTETTLTDLDLIKMMEERMVDLKRKNEEKLMEANQVLNYLGSIVKQDQRSNKAESGPDRPGSAQYSYVQVPRAYHSQTLEYGTNYESISESSIGTEQDSITGNSSGSSVSSIVPEARRVRYSPEIAVHPFYRRTESDTMDSEDDVSTDSTESGDGATVRQAETESSNSRVVQRGIDTASGPATAPFAAIVRTQLEMMEELTALRRDLATLQQQKIKVNQIWFMQAINSLFAKLERHFRPVPQPGTQRLEWTCECGEDMYADLPIQDESQYQQMLEFLTRPGSRAHQTNPDPTPSQLEGGTTQLSYSPLHLSQSSSSQHLSPSFTFGSGSTYVGTDASQTLSPSQDIFSGQNKYLELCVNINKYETKLAEIQVLSGQTNGAAICTDAHLFRQIYQRYHVMRKHNWRRFLYRPAGIRFVHFGVQTGERVSFFSSDPLPPEDVITAKRYEYNLQPPVPPPIDSRTFLHYFYKHGAHSHSTSAKYVNRLPKKLGDSLTRSLGADDLLEGWGIHIIEGPNKVAICWALMAVLAASLAVSIVYDFLTRSGESGFAIGQWMVAALTVGLSALYFSLEDDVNTSFDQDVNLSMR